MSHGRSRHGIQLLPLPNDIDVGGGAAPGPTPFERVAQALRAAWRRRWIAAAVFLVGTDASVVYYRLKPPVYRVEAILAQPRQATPAVSPGAVSDAPAQSAWQMVHRHENLLALIDEANLLSQPSTQPASGDLRERLRRTVLDPRQASVADEPTEAIVRRLGQALEVTARDGIVTVAIEWPDPEQAYRLVKVASKRLQEMRRAQAAETLDQVIKPAEVPKKPVSPDPLRVFGIGALASLLLAVVAAAAFDMRSGRIAEHGHVRNGAPLRPRGEGRGPAAQVAIERGAARRGSANREFQELWFALARRHWRSLVLVPADEGESVAAIAASLADVGRRLRRVPVTFFIMSNPIDYGSAAKIIAAFESTRQDGSELATASTGQVILAIQPVIAEPLGLAVTEAADVVVVCAEVGRSHLAAARRTIELIGRERIAGFLAVHRTSASSMNRPMRAAVPADSPRHELQQMWLSLMRGNWSSIVIVPTDADIPARVVIDALLEAAALHEMARFQVIDAVGVSPAAGERLAQELSSVVASGSRAIVAVDSIIQSLSGVPLVRDAKAALIVVRLGQSSFDHVQSTIDIVGRERILGAVTLPS
jgi:hypothetical protein